MANTEREAPNLSFRLPSLSPTVRPQNTFTPVAVGVSKDTEELVRSLRGLKGELTEAFSPLLKESREEAARKGAQAAQTNQLKFADAVSQGVIPETANPWFVKGFLQQQGRVDAIRYEMDMQTEWARSGIRNTDNAGEFQQWQQGFRRKYAEANTGNQTADYLAGFHAGADVADASLARQHSRTQQEEISNRVRENTGTEVAAILARYGGDAEKASYEINLLGQKMKADGLVPTEFRRIVADQVISTTKLTGNQGHLGVLDKVKLENGQPLSSDATVRKAKADLEYFLQQRSRSNQEWAWRVDDRQWTLQQRQRATELHKREDERWQRERDRWGREDFVRDALSVATAAVFSNPEDARNAAAPYMRELATRDPEAARNFASWIEGFSRSSREVDDRNESARLRWEMINAAGDPAKQAQLMQEAFALSTQGKLNQGTVSTIVEDANRWRQSRADKLLQDDQVRIIFNTVDKIAQQNPAGLFGQSAANALMGRQLLQREAMDFLTANPSATSAQLAEHLTKKMQALTPVLNEQVKAPTSGIQEEARRALGQPTPDVAARANALATAPIARVLLEAVSKAQSDAEVALILSQFDERIGMPGVAKQIISNESRKAQQPTKKR